MDASSPAGEHWPVDTPDNCVSAAAALRAQGRWDDADRVLRDATTRFPGEIELLRERALLAEQRLDWAAAEGFWRVCLALNAGRAGVFAGLATALERQGRPMDAETILAEVQRHPSLGIAGLIQYAEQADIQRDPADADRRWRAVRMHSPDKLKAYTVSAEALRQLRRFDEAAEILEEAVRRFGGEPTVLYQSASLADGRFDWPLAEARWRDYIAVNPNEWSAYLGLAKALSRQDRHREADAVFEDQQANRPTEIMYFIVYAEFAEQRGEWETANLRWDLVRRHFPDRQDGYEGIIRSLRTLGRGRQAAAVLAEAVQRLPDAPGLLVETARLAVDAGRTDEALVVWQQIRRKFPRIHSAYLDAEKVLREAGRFDEAVDVMTAALEQFPNNWVVWRQIGILAEARGDWPAAVAHWREMGQRFPGPESESWRLHQALLRLADADPAAADHAAQTPDMRGGAGDQASLRDMALSFESLGGTGSTGGCEFGIFQRDCGAEPLGLFRWATVLPANLIACLAAGFEGMGEPDTTSVFLLASDPDRLWQIMDKRYGTAMHSFVPSKDVPADRMAVSAQKRMRYLKVKLLDDLREGAKIFVLKLSDRHLTQAEAGDISKGIRSYGPGRLLCVCPADADHPEGSVEHRAPGVAVGYIDFSVPDAQNARKPAWLALCQKVLRGGAGFGVA